MVQKIQTLDEMMEDYDKERIAEIDRWEANKPQWIKDKIEADRQRDIELGRRDNEGNWIIDDLPENVEEDMDEPDEEEDEE